MFLNDDFLQSGSVSSSIIISDLSVGDYTFFVSDSECENIQNTFSIFEPTEIVVNIESVLSELPCFGDTIGFVDISVSGGVPPYTYLWSNNETTADIFDLSAGTYTLTVTDSTGCVTTFSQEIIEPDVFSISYEVSDISCYGEDDGFIDITTSGTGPFSYNWSNGSFDEDLVDLSPGIYVLDVFSDSDCGQETLELSLIHI